MTVNGSNTFRVRNTEMVGSITNGASTTFMVVPGVNYVPGYDINPGIQPMFPWLSGIARNFERFHFNALSVRLVPSAPTSTPGRLYAAIEYDWDDEPPTSKQQMMQKKTKAEEVVWKELVLRADVSALHRDMAWKYVSVNTKEAPEPRTSMCGFFIFAVDTNIINCTWDVLVSYDVSLETPDLDMFKLCDTLTPSVNTPQLAAAVMGAGIQQASLPLALLGTATPASRAMAPALLAGSNDVPSCILGAGIGTGYACKTLIDFKNVVTNPFILTLKIGTFSGTPTQLTANQTQLCLGLFDANGGYLGNTITNAASFSPSLQVKCGITPGSDCTTAGDPITSILSVPVSTLRFVYPALRYVAPLIFSVLDKVQSTEAWTTAQGGYQLEL